MYWTIFRLIRPRLERYAADRIAEYLQGRREQRLQLNKERPPDCPPCPPCPQEEAAVAAQVGILADPRNTFWFALSGLLLGGAFGMMTYIFIRDDSQASMSS
jgi:hypothetical protein